MDLSGIDATFHLDLKEIDVAIEKVNRLLALLERAKAMAGSEDTKED